MRTKEKILATALQLFNAHGTDPITVRHIAKEMNISHGNLCYHFPKKEDIIQQLYLNLVAELDSQISELQKQTPDVRMIMESVRKIFEIQYAYKFLLIDFVSIMRTIPPIRDHFRQLFIRRQQEFSTLIQYLTQTEQIQAESYPGQYQRFIAQFYIIGDFWIAEAEILFEGSDAEKLAYYTQVAYGLVYPYLTEKGQKAFKEVVQPHL